MSHAKFDEKFGALRAEYPRMSDDEILDEFQDVLHPLAEEEDAEDIS